MKIFKINERINIVCNSENTRYGFRHLATLFVNGAETAKGKCTYQNRTWERYEFQSVLYEVVKKSSLPENDKKICNDFIEGNKTDWGDLKSVGMVAKLGEIFGKDKKEKNDWKARMLKAGLENKGLTMPDDWDSLDEDTKQKRLDAVIKLCGEPSGN